MGSADPALLCVTHIHTHMSCLVSLSPEPPPTFMAQHSLLSYRSTCSLLLLVLFQALTPCSAPLLPVLGHIVQVLTNFHSCQIFLCQVPSSPLRTSAGQCFGQPSKKTLLWEPIVLHPGNMFKLTPDGVLSVLPLPLVSDSQRSAHTPVMEAVELFQVSPSSTQHSLPYCSTERMQALYMCLLVATVRCSSLKTAYLNAPKALDAFATLLFTSMCD